MFGHGNTGKKRCGLPGTFDPKINGMTDSFFFLHLAQKVAPRQAQEANYGPEVKLLTRR